MKSLFLLCSVIFTCLTPSHFSVDKCLKKSGHIKIYIETTDDDLRGGSWANLYINDKEMENFTDKQNLPNNTSQEWTVDCPDFDPGSINSVRLEHVSHEDFPQTADNWNINVVKVSFLNERNRWEEFAKGGPHRFDGSHRTLNLSLE
jgi:hypothetical protein